MKLQSLLDLALNTDAHGEDVMFREDVRVTMATGGLYDWLSSVLKVSGVKNGMDEMDFKEDQKKDKDDKKQQIIGRPVTIMFCPLLT